MGNFISTLSFLADQPVSSSNSISLLGWLIGFLIAAGVVTIVAWPLLNVKNWVRRTKSRDQEQFELDTLFDRLETEQLALDELEFDHDTGGLEENDYAQLKTNSQTVIQELEQEIKGHEQDQGDFEQQGETRRAMRREPEAVIVATGGGKALTTKVGHVVVNLPESELHRRHSAVKKAMHCSECGTAFKPSDRFCAKCDAPLPVVCQSCGAELDPDDRFCAKCGATVRR